MTLAGTYDDGGANSGGVSSTVCPTNATTVVKTGPGVYYGLDITVVGTTGVLTVFDNTAGSGKILDILTAGQGALTASMSNPPAPQGVQFATGLTVVSALNGPQVLAFFD